MGERPLSRVSIRTFPGLMSNKSPMLRKPGESSVQINCHCLSPGTLEIRGGFRTVTISTATALTTVVAIYADRRGTTTNMLVEVASGRLYKYATYS